MKTSSIQLTGPGTYLFHDNSRLSFSIDKELALVFSVPTEKTAGVVLFDPDHSLQQLQTMMQSILHKMTVDLGISPEKILVKVFGLSSFRKSVLETAYRWLKDRNIFITAEDTGRNFIRQILVECATGKVGVSYRTSEYSIPYLSQHTARDRNPLDEIHAQVLVLSSSSTKRILAKQSIEEHKNWVAVIPELPQNYLSKKTPTFNYAVAVIFDDLNEQPEKICNWIESIHVQYPEVQFRYSCSEIPKFLKHLSYFLCQNQFVYVMSHN